jgi:hypothetical protein
VKDDLAAESLEAELSRVSKAHQSYVSERDTLLVELEDLDVTAEREALLLEWAEEIRQGLADGDVDFETQRVTLDRLKVTAQVEYQDGVRGLRLRCVLRYAEKWLPLPVAPRSSRKPRITAFRRCVERPCASQLVDFGHDRVQVGLAQPRMHW